MPVTHILDRVKTGIVAVLDERSAPDDQIDFDACLTMIEVECEENGEDCCGHGIKTSAVSIYIAVYCPEMGESTRSLCHVMVPMSLLTDDEDVAEIGNDLWDRLQSSRLVAALELEDTPEDPAT